MVVSGVLVLWTLLTLGVRLYTRFRAKVSLGIDDVLCIAATVSNTATRLGLQDVSKLTDCEHSFWLSSRLFYLRSPSSMALARLSASSHQSSFT
jgi:hypothetical protein